MRSVRIIAAREFAQTWRARTFILTTILGIIGFVILSFVPTFINWIEHRSTAKVVVVDHIGGMLDTLNASLESLSKDGRAIVEFSGVPSDALPDQISLDQQLESGSIKAYLIITHSPQGLSEPVFCLGSRKLSGSQFRLVEQVIRPIVIERRMVDLGISAEKAASLQRPILAQAFTIDSRFDDSNQLATSQALAYLLMFLLYFTLIGYGSVLTNGVAAEKGSRVMEMMLVSVRPTDLLIGKILGLGAASLLQYALWVAVGLGVAWARGSLGNLSVGGVPLQLTTIAPSTILYFLLYYVLGYLAYSALFAAAGCLVNRPEESSQTVMPVVLLLVAAYLVACMALTNPSGTVARIASLVPFLTPMVMFTRIVMSHVPLSEILISILFSVAFVWLTILVGGRIYQNSVLRTRRTSWFEGLRGERS